VFNLQFQNLNDYRYLLVYLAILVLWGLAKMVYPKILNIFLNAYITNNSGLLFDYGINSLVSLILIFLSALLIFTKLAFNATFFVEISAISLINVFVIIVELLVAKSILNLVVSRIMFTKEISYHLSIKPLYSLCILSFIIFTIEILGFYQPYISLEIIWGILGFFLLMSFIIGLIQTYNHLIMKSKENQLYVFLYLCTNDLSFYTVVLYLMARIINRN